jgi:hypothetical protein
MTVVRRLPAVRNARLRTVLAVVSPVLVLAAGIITVAGSTMTWATVRTFGFPLVTVRGTDDDQHGGTTIALGALAMLSAVLLASRRGGDWGRLLAGTTGLMTSLTATVDIAHLRGGALLAGTGVEATTDIGPGLWLILGGGLAAFAGALLARLARPDAGGGGPPARRAARSGDSTRPVDPRSGDDCRKLWGRDGAPGKQQTHSWPGGADGGADERRSGGSRRTCRTVGPGVRLPAPWEGGARACAEGGDSADALWWVPAAPRAGTHHRPMPGTRPAGHAGEGW